MKFAEPEAATAVPAMWRAKERTSRERTSVAMSLKIGAWNDFNEMDDRIGVTINSSSIK